MKKIFLFLTILFLFFSTAARNPAKDLPRMMNWFEGRFDNFRQVSEEKESKAEFPHEHIHSILAPTRDFARKRFSV